MSQTAPSTITALPTPPSTSNVTSFDVRADAFLGQFPTLVTEVNNVASVTYNNAVDAYNNATTASAAAITAQQSATTAQAYAGAIAWVSGTTYAIGDVRWSPGNGRVYRRITNGAGTTDPYNDPTNWSLVPTSVPITRLTSALVTQASSGMFYEFANSTTQGAATNLFLYSEQLDNAAWTKSGLTVTAPGVGAPDGNYTANKYIPNNGLTGSWLSQMVSGQAAGTFTLSGHFAYAGGGTISLYFYSAEHGDNIARFDLMTGTLSSKWGPVFTSATTTQTHVGNGWSRFSVTFTTTGMTTFQAGIRHDIWTGDGTKGVFVWGLQLESGSTATSYIPTTSATVTRASGVVAPQRLILPLSPVNDMIVQAMVANGVDTNIVDPNGATIMGTFGPIQLDNPYASVTFQYSGSTWRMINA